MPFRSLRSRFPRSLLLLPLLLLPCEVETQQPAARGEQVAHVTNRSLQNVNISLVQGGRTIVLGRVNAYETRVFRLAVPPSSTDAILTASPIGDVSLKLVSEPLPITGRALTWEIIQMPSREMRHGVSTLILRGPQLPGVI
jgi:hypothetical protein